jgi:hypothetical protein
VFCQPDADEVKALEAKQKKAELDKEIEKVKKEHEDKMKRKSEKQKDKEKEQQTKDSSAEGGKQGKQSDEKVSRARACFDLQSYLD